MIKSTTMGHDIVFDPVSGYWFYEDGKIFDDSYPCPECGLKRDSSGVDPCMGYVSGAVFVCCGHGRGQQVIIMERS